MLFYLLHVCVILLSMVLCEKLPSITWTSKLLIMVMYGMAATDVNKCARLTVEDVSPRINLGRLFFNIKMLFKSESLPLLPS